MKSGIVLNFRYNDPSFSPKTIYGSIDESEEAKMKNLGIRMLYQLGKNIQYVHVVSYAELLIEL